MFFSWLHVFPTPRVSEPRLAITTAGGWLAHPSHPRGWILVPYCAGTTTTYSYNLWVELQLQCDYPFFVRRFVVVDRTALSIRPPGNTGVLFIRFRLFRVVFASGRYPAVPWKLSAVDLVISLQARLGVLRQLRRHSCAVVVKHLDNTMSVAPPTSADIR